MKNIFISRFTHKCVWIFPIIFLGNVSFIFFLSKNYSSDQQTIQLSRPNLKPSVLISFNSNLSYTKTSNSKKKNSFKSILIWNSPNLIETAVFGFGHDPFVKHECEVSDCTVFDSQSALPLNEYDAIVMHMCLIWLSDLPDFQRKFNQRFIFLSAESPASISRSLPDIVNMTNFFNWTMSYRLNSDIQLLYGRIEPKATAPKTPEETRRLIKATELQKSNKNFAKKKTRMVAWMVSHCDTPGLREMYVSHLRDFIPIDIYGKCGNLSCSRNATHSYSDQKCYDMLELKYKFYLSFENSICDDYVTEKFFEIMNRKIVPIVYGGANYSMIAPTHSYIDAMHYTPKRLAQYLKYLDGNDNLYNEYFWWKDHYRVEAGVQQMARNGFCDLCKKLHRDQNYTKSYSELISEWHPQKNCK
jgi:alpha-1,3-fucosyltransferase